MILALIDMGLPMFTEASCGGRVSLRFNAFDPHVPSAYRCADVFLPKLTLQRDESNTTTRDEITQKTGVKASICVADLGNREAVMGIIPSITKDGEKVDILLNCGGIQRRHPSEKFPDDDWDEVSYLLFFYEFFSGLCLLVPGALWGPKKDAFHASLG